MQLFPPLHLGWRNGWIFVVLLFLATDGLARMMRPAAAARLTDRSGWSGGDLLVAVLANIPVLALFLLLILTPLHRSGTWLAVGAALFLAGAAACVHAMFTFARSPPDRPVTAGLYRFSRHPQLLGMSVAGAGAAVAVGSWAALAAVALWLPFLHARRLTEERACLARYGEAYREYMARVPRYLGF